LVAGELKKDGFETRALVAGLIDSGSELARGRRGVLVAASGPGTDDRGILLPPAAARRSFPVKTRAKRVKSSERELIEEKRRRKRYRRTFEDLVGSRLQLFSCSYRILDQDGVVLPVPKAREQVREVCDATTKQKR